MDININELNEKKYIDMDITFDKKIYNNKNIDGLDNCHVKGYIGYNASDNLEVDLSLVGNMILKDSVTLDNINYPLDLKIKEEYEINSEFLQEYTKIEQKTLDIMKILWENIVLEVPIRLTTHSNLQMQGDGWSLGEEHKNNEIDPRLAKLASLADKIGKE